MAKVGNTCMLRDNVSIPQVPQGRLKLLQMSLAHLVLSRLAPASSAKMRQVTVDITQDLQDELLTSDVLTLLPFFFPELFLGLLPIAPGFKALRRISPQSLLATAERASQQPTSGSCLCCTSKATGRKQYCALVPLSDIRRSPSHVGKLELTFG